MSALSAVLLICSFQFSPLFFHIGRQAAQRTAAYWFTKYQTSDVAKNLGMLLGFLYGVQPGDAFELILTVRMEARVLDIP